MSHLSCYWINHWVSYFLYYLSLALRYLLDPFVYPLNQETIISLWLITFSTIVKELIKIDSYWFFMRSTSRFAPKIMYCQRLFLSYDVFLCLSTQLFLRLFKIQLIFYNDIIVYVLILLDLNVLHWGLRKISRGHWDYPWLLNAPFLSLILSLLSTAIVD